MSANENPIWSHVEAKAPRAIELADRVFDTPEIAYTGRDT